MPAPTLTGLSAAHRTGDRASASWIDLIEADGPVSGMPRMAALKAGAAAGPMAAGLEPVGPLAFAGTGGPSVGIAPVARVGTEIRVNTATAGNQDAAQITTLSNGGFVVTWTDASNGVGGATGDSSVAAKAQVFAADGTRVGTEILVNTATAGSQNGNQITALSNGGFVISWSDGSQGVGGAMGDTSSGAVKAQVFAANGTRVGAELLVNTATANLQAASQITTLSNGGFVITWHDGSAGVGGATGDTSGNSIKGQMFAADGTRVGTELLVNTATLYAQNFPQITALSNGGFVVTWTDSSLGVGGATGDLSNLAVKAQVFAADGARVGSELLVNTATANNQDGPQITALSNGGFVVTWVDDSRGVGGASGDASSIAVKAQVFAADGTRVGSELLVNTATADVQDQQQITALSNGGFVVTWRDASAGIGGATGDTASSAIKAQVFAADGSRVGSELLVNSATASVQAFPQITALSNGGFVVTWVDDSRGVGGASGDASNIAVKAQVFAADGARVGTELLVNTATAGGQSVPQITALPNGGFVVTWTDFSLGNGGATGDNAGSAIKAQVFNTGLDAVEQVALSLKNRGFSVTDPDAGDVLSVTLSVTYGAINVTAGTSGATVASGNGTASVVISGTASQITALLNSNATSTVTYTADTDTPPATATVTLSANDGAGGTATTTATITIVDTFDAPAVGTANADTLSGTTGADTIDGLGGDDILSGRAGNDILNGNTGNDTASYASAAAGVTARLNLGTASNDGDGGSDTFVSIENLTGSAFIDLLVGNGIANVLNGGLGADTLLGLGGNDILIGGTGANNTLQGGLGDDLYVVDANDTVIELSGEGTDTVQTSRTTYLLRTHVENLQYTGSAAFRGTGNAADNTIEGGSGNDVLIGRGGNDRLDGNGGTDTADYSAAAGAVTASLLAGAASNDGDGGTDVLGEIENLTGSAFADSLTGSAGANVLNGGSGHDVLAGRGGNDVLNGGAGTDTADYSGAAGGVDLKLALNTATNDGDGGSDTFISIENITGSAFNDTLSGDGLANVINGGLGADFLQGLGGNDTLIGGAGTANQLQGGLGDDTYVVDANDTIVEFSGEGTDTVQTSRNFQPLAANVENLTFTGTGNFTGIGNALANVITGGAGNDSLTGGLGNDTLNGGAGTADMMVVQGLVGSYTVTDLGGGSYRIVDAVGGRDGTDTTTGVELIRFSNGATVALASLVPPPAPLQPVDKTAGGPQVLPGLSDDDFLPLAKDGDLPLVLPGAEDPFADLFLGPDQMSLDQGSGSPWQMLSLDQDGTLDQAFDGIVGALDRSGWNHDTWSF